MRYWTVSFVRNEKATSSVRDRRIKVDASLMGPDEAGMAAAVALSELNSFEQAGLDIDEVTPPQD